MTALGWLLASLRRTWDETVAPPIFGEEPTLRRLLRLRMASAIVLSVPAHLFVVFYLAQAVLAHYRTERGTGDHEPLTLELVQLHLHDRLRHDYHHLMVGAGQAPPRLEKLSLFVRNADLDRLDAQLPPGDGPEGYVPAELEHRGARYAASARYRGSNHWNWNFSQKSWKLRLEEDRHLLGHETLLVTNSPEPEPLLELVALELAERRGLMVPHFEPIWLEVNGAGLGVQFFEAPVDESVLRHAGRFPWSIFSGNGAPADPATGVSQLFDSAAHWTKVAGPLGKENDISELEELLAAIRAPDPRAFARFADERLALRAFAELDALDVVFGIDQHNYNENQKFYYDPYRGTFEPIVWNLRGGNHEPLIQRAPSPLVLRLSELVTFRDLRDERVWSLLHGDASAESLSSRLTVWDEKLAAAFDQDQFWDAVGLVPKLSPYFEGMVRPMDRGKQLEARAIELGLLAERNAFLRRELARLRLEATLVLAPPAALGSAAPAPKGNGTAPLAAAPAAAAPTAAPPARAILSVTVDGRAPVEVLAMVPGFASKCADGGLSWRRRPPAGVAEEAWRRLPSGYALGTPERLHPGTVRVARRSTFARGAVRVEPAAQRFDFELQSPDCPLGALGLKVRNVRTGAVEERTVKVAEGVPPGSEPCGLAFNPGPGGRGLHPWCVPRRAAPVSVPLGPGEIAIGETRVYEADRRVVIAPGTTLRFAPGASLVFRGRVTAVGTAAEPIRFVGTGWGAVAVAGAAADGSRFEHVEMVGGGEGRIDGRHYPGMLSVHDTEGFTLRSARLRDAAGENAVHLVYARRATLEDVRIERARLDGVDLEHSEVLLRRVAVIEVGDDALDLMGTQVVAEDLDLIDCKDNGISAGERSEVSLARSVIARCPMGLLAKNTSSFRFEEVVVAAALTGLRIERRSDYYLGESYAEGSGLWFVAVDDPKKLVDRPRCDLERSGEPKQQDIVSLLNARGLAVPADLTGWRGTREVAP